MIFWKFPFTLSTMFLRITSVVGSYRTFIFTVVFVALLTYLSKEKKSYN